MAGPGSPATGAAATGLRARNRLAGPAIVEQFDSTTVILPGQAAHVDALGNILIGV
jgi:N-methylhydantoinase A/oxoprolinase/acetone carboxylase beta subunit